QYGRTCAQNRRHWWKGAASDSFLPGDRAESFDQCTDTRVGLQRGTIDDQAGRYGHDLVSFDQSIIGQRAPGGYEVHNPHAKAERRGEFHRSVQLYAFGLNTLTLKPPFGDVRILGGNAQV